MKYFLSLIILFSIMSCSDDTTNETPEIRNYFDLQVGNSWTYDNTSTQNGTTTSGTETLTVNDIRTENNRDYFNFVQTEVTQPGLITSILTSGELYESNNNQTLVFTGDYNFDVGQEFPSLNFELNEAPIYNQTAATGAVIYNDSNSIIQQIQGIPLEINYSIEIVNGGNIGSLAVNNETYDDVYLSEIIITANIEADFDITVVEVLKSQEVVKTQNYFAPDIGLIKSDVSTTAVFEDYPQISFPDISSTSSQTLIDFGLVFE